MEKRPVKYLLKTRNSFETWDIFWIYNCLKEYRECKFNRIFHTSIVHMKFEEHSTGYTIKWPKILIFTSSPLIQI